MSPILDDEPTGISWLDNNPTTNDVIARLRQEALAEMKAKAARHLKSAQNPVPPATLPGREAEPKSAPPDVAPPPPPVVPPPAPDAPKKRGRPKGSGATVPAAVRAAPQPVAVALAPPPVSLPPVAATPPPTPAITPAETGNTAPRKRGRPTNAERAARRANNPLETALDTLALLPTAEPLPPPPAPSVITPEIREAARTAAFGKDGGYDGWADFGSAKKDENGRWKNRLGLTSTESHRHVAAAWQASGCVKLRAFRQEQELAAERKWDENALSLNNLKIEGGQFHFSDGDKALSAQPTAHAIYQLANIAGAKPSSVQALYDVEFATLRAREEGETLAPPNNFAERIALGDEILNKHLSWLSPEVRGREKLFRFRDREDDSTECRAVLSSRYGILDQDQMLEVLWEAIPAEGREDVLVSYVEDDGNRLTASLLFPDHIKDAPDSEYGVGLKLRNAEDGSWAWEVSPWLFRAICYNGSVWGIREKRREKNMRKIHLGNMDVAQLINRAKQTIKLGLSEGLAMFDLMQLSQSAPVPNPEAVIAFTTKQAGIGTKASLAVAHAFKKEPARSGWGVVNAWTLAAQAFKGDTRNLFEKTGASLMGPSLDADQAAVRSHWETINNQARRYAEKEQEQVLQFQQIIAG